MRLKKASKSAARLWHHMRGYEALPCALFRDCGAVHMNEVVFQRRGDFIMSSPEEQLMPSRKSQGGERGGILHLGTAKSSLFERLASPSF